MTRGAWSWIFYVIVIAAGVLGIAQGVLGVRLVTLGGTWFYLIAGAIAALGAALALSGRRGSGVATLAVGAAATVLWSFYEIAGKGWGPAWAFDFLGRSGVVVGLAAAAAGAYVFALRPVRRGARKAVAGAASLAALAGVAGLAFAWQRPVAPSGPQGAGVAAQPGSNPASDWTAFGGSTLAQRYSPASQITPENVGGLVEAWRFRTQDAAPNERVFFSAQNTPLKIGDTLYACSASAKVFALDPATGQVKWRFDPRTHARAMESLFSVACRSVGYHESHVMAQAAPIPASAMSCVRRVFVATADGRLIGLDARTGAQCEGFGRGGVVDLTEGMDLQDPGFASNTSGPTVAGDMVIVGQQVSDNQRRDAPSGVVRAYDARTGALRWAWDAHRADATAPLAPGERFPRGTPNVWNVISADPSLGLVYLATGNPGADHWGGTRTPQEDRFTAAVVAVDLATGATRWSYATVDHDLWDYDLGAQPMIVDVAIDGASRRALVQGTKTGSIFMFDAADGTLLRPVERKATPQSGVLPGDFVAPTQPQSTFFPNFAGKPGRDPEVIDARHAFGLTPIDGALCRIQFHQMRYEGMYTPPTDQGRGMLLFPGTVGGLNWGGLGVDPGRGVLITNHSRLPNQVLMVPRKDVKDKAVGDGGARPDQAVAPQAGTPYGVKRPIWLSPLGVPCIAPPWGYLSGTDINTGKLLWTQPLGTGYDSGPLGLPTFVKVAMGTANLGGPVVTASGLTFIAAAQDDFLRAFETRTGRLLWEGRLPAGGQASAMTYMHEGRQYVVIVAAGHARFETRSGDYVIAFALKPQ